MSTVPIKQSPVIDQPESMEERFQRLATIWRAETLYISSSTAITAHPAFQEIVAMGPAVIPLLLREVEKGTLGHWHRALRLIAGTSPLTTADQGKVDKANEAWLRWGKEHGYKW